MCCGVCNKSFSKPQYLGSHFRHNPTHRPTLSTPLINRKKRKRYKVDEKLRIVKKAQQLALEGHINAVKLVADVENIPISSLYDWMSKATILQEHADVGLKKHRRLNTAATSRVKYPAAEAELYMAFHIRRQLQGLVCSGVWLQIKMKQFVIKIYTDASFTASEGWLEGFKTRFRITAQRKTKKKQATTSQRLPKIIKFHRATRQLQQSQVQGVGERHHVYGRFSPERMYHMDQVPLPFALVTNRTLNAKGKPVYIQLPKGSGLDKRQATLQVTIRAQGAQHVRLALIFRGSGKQVNKRERLVYKKLSPFIKVYWQNKAWADGVVMKHWMHQFVDDAGLNPGTQEVLLGADNHGSQITPHFKAYATSRGNVLMWYSPPDCTDCCAPVDCHIGNQIKVIMKKFYEQALEDNLEAWTNPVGKGGISASDRRMHMAHWAAKAWIELQENYSQMIEDSFVKTGWLLPLNKSKDHVLINEMKSKHGIDNYTF